MFSCYNLSYNVYIRNNELNLWFVIWANIYWKLSFYKDVADLEFSRLQSWSRDLFLQVLVLNLRVLVLEPSSLGFGTWDHGDSVFVTHEAWNWDKIHSDTFKVLHPLLEKVFCPPATSTAVERIFLATVVCWCGQTGLEWVTTCRHSWSTCNATISC